MIHIPLSYDEHTQRWHLANGPGLRHRDLLKALYNEVVAQKIETTSKPKEAWSRPLDHATRRIGRVHEVRKGKVVEITDAVVSTFMREATAKKRAVMLEELELDMEGLI